jgi:hypothetical protein
MKETWYQVWLPGNQPKVFGFAAIDGYITKHPDYRWLRQPLSLYKKELINLRAVVTKIN